MRAVLQRVNKASVSVGGKIVGQCDKGWFVLLGVTHSDTSDDVDYLVQKIVGLRGFGDEQDRMNLSVQDINGGLLVISQFTLYGTLSRGRRPSFSEAASPEHANALYEAFVAQIRERGLPLGTGIFGAKMTITAECDGPVTFFLDSQISPS